MRDSLKNQSNGKWAILAVAVLFVAMTAGAISANSRTRTATPQLWKQTPNFVLSLPGGYGIDEVLY